MTTFDEALKLAQEIASLLDDNSQQISFKLQTYEGLIQTAQVETGNILNGGAQITPAISGQSISFLNRQTTLHDESIKLADDIIADLQRAGLDNAVAKAGQLKL